MIPLPRASLLLHLTAVDKVVPALVEWSEEDGFVDAADYLLHEIDSDEPAGWRVLGDAIFHSKALAAVLIVNEEE